jgi:hypothetical protein
VGKGFKQKKSRTQAKAARWEIGMASISHANKCHNKIKDSKTGKKH